MTVKMMDTASISDNDKSYVIEPNLIFQRLLAAAVIRRGDISIEEAFKDSSMNSVLILLVYSNLKGFCYQLTINHNLASQSGHSMTILCQTTKKWSMSLMGDVGPRPTGAMESGVHLPRNLFELSHFFLNIQQQP